MTDTHPIFVPAGESRKDTAILLVGTADEHGISQQSIKTTWRGFWITEELADAVGVEREPDEDSAQAQGTEAVADEQADEQADADEDADEDADDSFVVADHSVKDVKAFVEANPGTAADVLDAEREGENRPTLVSWLQSRVEADTDSGDLPGSTENDN